MLHGLQSRSHPRLASRLGSLLVLGLLSLVAAPLRAQTILLVLLFGPKVSEENLHFSMKLGVNSARTTGVDDASSRWGFTYGVQLNVGLDDAGKWWLLPEITPLSPKGVEGAGVVPAYIQGNPELDVLLANTTRTRTRFNFIDFPVMLSYRPIPIIRIGAGPYAAFRTSAHSLFVTSADPVGEFEIDKNSGEFYQRWDYGAAIEVGYSPWGSKTRGRPTILVRYQWGFADLLRDNPGPAIRNRLLQFSAVFPYLPRKDKDESAVDE
jgi:hypothetical protein